MPLEHAIADVLGDRISNMEYLACLGDDLMVVNAARVSYAVESKWQTVTAEGLTGANGDIPTTVNVGERLSAEDERLIKYLASHGHWTPFSQPQVQFRLKMPIFVAREWYRHNVGLTRNEVSRRYVNSSPEVFVPRSLRNKPGPGQSKQGSQGVHESSEIYISAMRAHMRQAVELYDGMIADGVAPEQARIVLPVGMYTEFIETGSLAAYARICKLRLQPDAMLETRKYAQCISDVMAVLFPVSWKELMV